jgi:hypothetical protein
MSVSFYIIYYSVFFNTIIFIYYYWILDGSVGIATGYRLDGQRSIPDRTNIFFLPHSVQTGSETHPASYAMDTGSSFP